MPTASSQMTVLVTVLAGSHYPLSISGIFLAPSRNGVLAGTTFNFLKVARYRLPP